MQTSLPCEPLLAALLSDADEALVAFDRHGTILLWSAGALRLYGMPAPEAVGKHISTILPLYELPAVEELLDHPELIDANHIENAERLDIQRARVAVQLRRSVIRNADGEFLAVLERTTLSKPALSPSAAEMQLCLLVDQLPVTFWTADQRLSVTSQWGSRFGAVRSSRGKSPELSVHEFLRCGQTRETPVKQHLDALQGISSRFEYRRRKRIFEISLEPLRDPTGSIVGCIGVALDISERKPTEEEIRYHATHDGLTGLANYREFIERLENEVKRAERNGRSFGLLLLDLDELKRINDKHGHLAGNRALKQLARIMKEHSRATDVAARYGGDEFGLLLIDADEHMAGQVANRIANCLRLQTEAPALSVSIGSAVYGIDGSSAQELLEAADQRLYRNKRSSSLQPLTVLRDSAVCRLS